MNNDGFGAAVTPPARRLRLEVELYVDIDDPDALRDAALAALGEPAHLDASDGDDGDAERQARAKEVREDPASALSVLLEPFVLIDEIPGVAPRESAHSIQVDESDGLDDDWEVEDWPDFAELFPLGDESSEREQPWCLTPRTAALLHASLAALGDIAYVEIEKGGNTPVLVEERQGWAFFSRLPRVSWRQEAEWRRRMARSCDDLVDDLERGERPVPRCNAEGLVLHLAVRDAAAECDDEPEAVEEWVSGLPTHSDDFAWEAAEEALSRGSDILQLYRPEADGIEDPDSKENQQLDLGDLRPHVWFQPFASAEPRDPGRGFRQ